MAKKDEDDDTAWYLQTGFLLSAGFLALLLIVGLILVLTGPTRRDGDGSGYSRSTAPTTSTPTQVGTTAAPTSAVSKAQEPTRTTRGTAAPMPVVSGPSPTNGPANAPGSVCGLAAGDQSLPLTPPAASWTFVGTIAVPISRQYGPATAVDGIGNCYAHSPTGALFAMVDTLGLTEVGGDQISAAKVVEERGSRSGDYATALTEAQQQDAQIVMPADSSTAQKITVLGYRYVDYSPARATIAIAVGLGDPTRQATYQPSTITATVTWEAGDWKFVYSAATAQTTAPIISTEQYTAWAA